MKKKLILVLTIAVLSTVFFVYYFCRVHFTDDHLTGSILKKEDGIVEATIYTYVYNGSFFDKKITFTVGGSGEYQNGYLKNAAYGNVQIEILDGAAEINDERNCVTIPGRKKVGLIITAQNEYIKSENAGKMVYLKRAAPDDIKIVTLH